MILALSILILLATAIVICAVAMDRAAAWRFCDRCGCYWTRTKSGARWSSADPTAGLRVQKETCPACEP